MKRTREQIMEQMHVPESRMEIRVRKGLQAMGIRYFSDCKFPLETKSPQGRQKVARPDIMLPDYGTLVFLDGEKAHEGREGKDESIREELARLYPSLKILGIAYNAYTTKAYRAIMKEILGAIGK